MKEYEEVKQRHLESDNETKKLGENDQEWKKKLGEDQEAAHTNEPKKNLKEYAEAATEELFRKKSEISEVKEKNEAGRNPKEQKKSRSVKKMSRRSPPPVETRNISGPRLFGTHARRAPA